MTKRRVLVSAFACAPCLGSEPGVGWGLVRELSRHCDVHVLTRSKYRPALEAALAREPRPSLRFEYYDGPRALGWLADRPFGEQLHYYAWQLGALDVARRLHREVGFDVVHHVTYVKYWQPSLLSLLGTPFVWGPVGGGDSAPPAFSRSFGLRGRVYEWLRNLGRRAGECDPLVRLTARRSRLAVGATAATTASLRRLGVKRVRTAVATQLAVDDESFLVPAPPAAPPAPVRFIGMGRLLHWKGFHLALRALAASGLGEAAELWLLGDGPERGRLEAEARALGVDRRARFLGEVTRTEALARLGECHVLVHPSLHDTSPSVLNEAMAAGRPIVCLALGGPAVQVTDATGIRVPATDVEGAVRGLAEGMRSLAASPELRARMGEAARALARERTWDARAREVRRWYDELCGSGNGHGHGHGHDGGNRCA